MTRSFFSAAASGKNFCRHIAAESKFFAGHITQIFIHAVQQFHIRPVQLNAERGKVFLQTLDMVSLSAAPPPRRSADRPKVRRGRNRAVNRR